MELPQLQKLIKSELITHAESLTAFARRYARHSDECASCNAGQYCTCGYNTALAALNEQYQKALAKHTEVPALGVQAGLRS